MTTKVTAAMLADDVLAMITAAAQAIGPGFSMIWRGVDLPLGRWLWEDGKQYPIADYPELYAAIGTTYNLGDEDEGHFRVADSRGVADIGRDDMGGTAANRVTTAGSGIDGKTLGARGGAQSVTLTAAQIPAHTHPVDDDGHSHGYSKKGSGAGGPFGVGDNGYDSNELTDSSVTGITVAENTGGGGAHNNMQPSLVCNKVIRY